MSGWDWVGELAQLKDEGRRLALVTVTDHSGSTPREAGAKMIVLEDGSIRGTIGGGHLEELAIADARKCISEGESRAFRYPLGAKTGQCCGGTVGLFVEAINSGPSLYLFGAGHVGQAVARVMLGTPFTVHVIDERPEWIGELPKGVVRHDCEWDEFVREARWDDQRTFVAIMTHRHDTDQAIVEALLDKPLRYLGLIGSRSKRVRFEQRLTARGTPESLLARVRCPIGIDVGGKAPQEVAISLAAELLKLHYGR